MKSSIQLLAQGALAVWLLSLAAAVAQQDPHQPAQSSTRAAQVAGSFYPSAVAELTAFVDKVLAGAAFQDLGGDLTALIAPHAGYQYSGAVAAQSYAQIKKNYRRVFIVGSNHNAQTPPFIFSVAGEDFFSTPLGQVRIWPEVKTLLSDRRFQVVPAANTTHVIEVHLPFLQTLLKDFELVPIITGNVSERDLTDLVLLLDRQLGEDDLLIISSDLSHYHPYEQAQRTDAACVSGLEHLDMQAVRNCEACGRPGLEVVTGLARRRGWQAKLLDARNSGDVAGDHTRVVGYAALAFYKKKYLREPVALSAADQKQLLNLARSTIAAKLTGQAGPEPLPGEGQSSALSSVQACFVTLKKNEELRGCIGNLSARQSLWQCVMENSQFAAFHDPRFEPVQADELSALRIEISVLSEPQLLLRDSAEDLLSRLRPGRDGVILKRGERQSTFLPQVWQDLPAPGKFLGRLCVKGGLPENCWQDPATEVRVYQDTVFSE